MSLSKGWSADFVFCIYHRQRLPAYAVSQHQIDSKTQVRVGNETRMVLNIDLKIFRQLLSEKLRDKNFEELSHVYRERQKFMTADVYAGPRVLERNRQRPCIGL